MGRAKLELLARLMEAMRYGVRVAIDCSLEQTMRDLVCPGWTQECQSVC